MKYWKYFFTLVTLALEKFNVGVKQYKTVACMIIFSIDVYVQVFEADSW